MRLMTRRLAFVATEDVLTQESAILLVSIHFITPLPKQPAFASPTRIKSTLEKKIMSSETKL